MEAHPHAERPHVLIVGGFLSSPPFYWQLARRLRKRRATSVAIAPIWLPDWILAIRTGLGPLGRRTARVIVREWRLTGGRPLLVIGHSAGGILARLAMSPVPFEGHRTGVGEAVGALVTLGSPHHVVVEDHEVAVEDHAAVDEALRGSPHARLRRSHGRRWASIAATDFLDVAQPGAARAPRTGYVTVASSKIAGGPIRGAHVARRYRFAGNVYEALLGEQGQSARGDGVIPVDSAHLDGATQITLDDVVHDQVGGGPWYGSDEVIDRWWPAALDAWRAAGAARAAAEEGRKQ